MSFFDFIFLQRKLAKDKSTIVSNLERSKKSSQPMWLVLFPEGTVVSESTRKKSKEFAEKSNIKDNRYTLLPRSTGLALCAATLDGSVEYLYDFTIGYSGIGPNDIPEKVYTIQSIFFFNFYPKHINIHVRRFKLDTIPKEKEVEFNQWVHKRWVEKDSLMCYFYKHGHFPNQVPEEDSDYIVHEDQQSQGRTFSIPVKLNTSMLSLAQTWIFLVPYLYMIKLLKGWFLGVESLSA